MLTNDRPIIDLFDNPSYSNSDNIGTRDNEFTRVFESCLSSNLCPENRNAEEGRSHIVIFRYKFTEQFIEELYKFSKIHQYDHRKDFKEAWQKWVQENEEIIHEETERLKGLGYEGDVLDKMFKSARYYFRKKSLEKKEPKQRRQYISVNRELLEAMDNHIEKSIKQENYQPKTGYLDFCKEYENILKESINCIFEKEIRDAELIEEKIKKTYKNRYFMFVASKNT